MNGILNHFKVHNFETNKYKNFTNEFDWNLDNFSEKYFNGKFLTKLKILITNEECNDPKSDTTNELFGAFGFSLAWIYTRR